MTFFDSTAPRRGFLIGAATMAFLVTLSNILVQFPLNDWLTWAAFSYPICFLVTDLTNRALGARAARRVVFVGFALGVCLSVYFASWRIGLASGSAFLVAQLIDIQIFDRLRRAAWWWPPLVSSVVASLVDTLLFFGLAFYGTEVPWVTLALGDYAVKVAMALAMLLPYRALLTVTRPRRIA